MTDPARSFGGERDRRALRRRTRIVRVSHGKGQPRRGAMRARPKYWIVPVALLVAVIGWVGIRGYLAKMELEQAQALVSELKASAGAMKLDSLEPTFEVLAGHSQAAKTLTSDPVWRLLEFVPLAGRNLSVVRELAAATDETVETLGPLVRFASTLDPASLAPIGGVVPIKPFEDLVPLVQETATDLAAVQVSAHEIDTSFALAPIVDAKSKFMGLLDQAVAPLEQASSLVPLLPELLGSQGTKNYVVMFQNNAEVRSLGGTALSFALMTIDHGKIELKETVPAGFDNFPQLDKSIIPVPDGFQDVFPQFGRFIPNATVRPSFPTAGAVIYENWRKARGVKPDGVISLDAVALSHVLKATGPIELSSGETLDATNVVRVLLNELYQRLNSGDPAADNAAQDVVYAETVAQTFAHLASGQFDMPTLLQAVFTGFGERRISYWSSDPDQQALIDEAGLANDLPESTGETDAIGIYVNDNVGSKLNYYLQTSVTTSSAQCGVDGRQVHRVIYRMESLLDPKNVDSLSPSVAGQYKKANLGKGVQRLLVFVYAPVDSTILGLSVDGRIQKITSLHDTEHPVARTTVILKPGKFVSVSVDLLMGTPGDRAASVQMTPLLLKPQPTEEPLDCSTVATPADAG